MASRQIVLLALFICFNLALNAVGSSASSSSSSAAAAAAAAASKDPSVDLEDDQLMAEVSPQLDLDKNGRVSNEELVQAGILTSEEAKEDDKKIGTEGEKQIQGTISQTPSSSSPSSSPSQSPSSSKHSSSPSSSSSVINVPVLAISVVAATISAGLFIF